MTEEGPAGTCTSPADAAVELVPYDPAWPGRFRAESERLGRVLSRWLVAPVEHTGSTAVPGLVAKPVIDIMAPVSSLEASRDAIAAAATLGYLHAAYRDDVMHWFCKPSPRHRTHHLHLVPHGSRTWSDRLLFRDRLRRDATLRRDYARLKRTLAATHRNDRDAYSAAKGPFIEGVLTEARAAGALARGRFIGYGPGPSRHGEVIMSESEDPRAWITHHIEQYQADGEAGHLWDSSFLGGPGPLPTLLLTTVGRRAGEERVMPLLYGKVDTGYAVVASKGGAPAHPAWYLNLVARPAVGV